MKKLVTLALAAAALGFSGVAFAQDNLLAEKPIYTLGDAKTWTAGEESYTFITADLAKLVAVPTNTANVYLYPENGALNTPENQALGIQGFYVDMEQSTAVKTVTTTWEGAAANAYNIYLTDAVPTLDVLSATPTYSASGLGQYATNVATLPDNAKGRYLVFQPTEATNYGWGVKIRSISASAPAKSVLTTFTAQPLFVVAGTSANMTLSVKDQFGLDMSGVEYSVTGGTLENGVLTISGESAVISAKAGDVTLTQTVYAVSAPEAPLASNIALPIYTNTVTTDNGTAGFIAAYNGGAKELGRLTFANGDVAAAFGEARCIFFYNNNPDIMGGWDKDIDPSALGLGSLHIDVFATKNVEGNVVFEQVTAIPERTPITLKAGEWNHIEVPVAGETKLHTLSVRFDEANASDIVVTNIYFTPVVDESDVTAPVFGEVTVAPEFNSAVITMTATDESKRLTYTLTVNDKEYKVTGLAGETVKCTVDGLEPEKEYTASIVVTDGKNASEPKTVTFTTKAAPAVPTTVPTPDKPADEVVSLFSSAYTPATTFGIGGWGQSTVAEVVTIDGKEVYKLTNFNYLGWEFAQHIDVKGYTSVHVDFYTLAPTTFGFTPISPGQEKPWIASEVKAGEWNSYDVPLTHWSNVNFADLFQFKFDQGKNVECYIANVYFWKDPSVVPDPDPIEGNGKTYYGRVTDTFSQTFEGNTKDYPYTLDYEVTYNEDKTLTVKANYTWTNGEPVGLVAGSVFINNQLNDFAIVEGKRQVKTTTTYNEADVIPLKFYLPAANGVVEHSEQYVVGSTSTDPASISQVVSARQADGAIYDMQGRKVAKAGRGLYIVNGKKVFVK